MKTKEQIEKSLKEFCLIDKNRPQMEVPFMIDKNHVVATDGHAMLIVETDHDFGKCKKENFEKSVKEIIDCREDACTESVLINLTDLNKALELVPFYMGHPKEECSECNGEGEVQCECCGNITDCDFCNGKGYFVDESQDKVKIFKINNTAIKIADVYFHPSQIERIVDFLNAVNTEKLTMKYYEKFGPAIFKSIDFKIIQMPIREQNKEHIIDLLKINELEIKE